MQNNDNQTNQKGPQNGGQSEVEYISPGLCSIWLGIRFRNIYFSADADVNVEEIRQLLDEEDDDVEVSS